MFKKSKTLSTPLTSPEDIEKVGKSICNFPWDEFKGKDCVELYSGLVYVFSLYQKKLLGLPVDVVWDDRPDLSFSFPGFSVGLEVTKATTNSSEHAYAVANKKHPEGANIELDMCRSNSTSPEIVKKTIRPFGKPWQGSGLTDYSDEKFWIKCIGHSIEEKTESLNKVCFKKFTNNELIILDETGAISPISFNLIYAVSQVRVIYHNQAKKCTLKYDKIHIATRVYNANGEYQTTKYCLLYDVLGNCRKIIYKIDS